MNSKQEDKFSMYYVVRNTCEKYQTTWASNAVFSSSYNLWQAKIPLIEQNRDAQTVKITGYSSEKHVKRAAMIEKALYIDNRLQSFANATNNSELIESVRYTASELKQARDTDAIGICNSILTKASNNASEIWAYGVPDTLIAELQTAINEYDTTIAKPSVAIAQRKNATQNLIKLFKEADDILRNRLDLDIELFKNSKPDFYSQYKSSRNIRQSGSRAMSVLGKVIDADNGKALQYVNCTFAAKNKEEQEPVIKKSTAKGRFRVMLPEGVYDVSIRKIGYITQNHTVNVIKGETRHLDIALQSIYEQE